MQMISNTASFFSYPLPFRVSLDVGQPDLLAGSQRW